MSEEYLRAGAKTLTVNLGALYNKVLLIDVSLLFESKIHYQQKSRRRAGSRKKGDYSAIGHYGYLYVAKMLFYFVLSKKGFFVLYRHIESFLVFHPGIHFKDIVGLKWSCGVSKSVWMIKQSDKTKEHADADKKMQK